MESEFIDWLRQQLRPHPQLRLGPGDDAAILRLGKRADCVVTTDLLSDGVDFLVDRVSPRRIGHKSLGVNLSDLAAMASVPLAAVVSLLLPRAGGRKLAERIYEGLLPLAERFNVAIAGGDTNSWDGPLVVSITAIGEVTSRGPLLRSGAQPGDAIIVTGAFGGSILGRHLDVEPRVEEALLLAERYDLHAGIDVSDGLAVDLAHICVESGCGAVLRTPAVPIAPAALELAESANDGISPLEHALGDGEDFELILAVPPDQAEEIIHEQPLEIPLTQIGEFITDQGLWQVGEDEARRPLIPRGFEHPLD